MAGIKGRSGVNRHKDKPFADALRLEVSEAGDDQRKLRQIARKLLEMAIAGDMQAIAQVADRLDGKPAQESTLNVIRTVAELTDQEIAARLAELRGDGSSDGDATPSPDPSKLN